MAYDDLQTVIKGAALSKEEADWIWQVKRDAFERYKSG